VIRLSRALADHRVRDTVPRLRRAPDVAAPQNAVDRTGEGHPGTGTAEPACLLPSPPTPEATAYWPESPWRGRSGRPGPPPVQPASAAHWRLACHQEDPHSRHQRRPLRTQSPDRTPAPTHTNPHSETHHRTRTPRPPLPRPPPQLPPNTGTTGTESKPAATIQTTPALAETPQQQQLCPTATPPKRHRQPPPHRLSHRPPAATEPPEPAAAEARTDGPTRPRQPQHANTPTATASWPR